ncbi:hypothetical protein AB0D45_02975 [Streptomyces sp. NPDC048352]|uniref:hypothetical protein n=1 Tax=Streptomyces sp. NPDC048352 TaxID=3154718 RepID=UPI0034136359
MITVSGIPFWWSVIDMSFGVFGILPLLVLRRLIKRLEALQGDGDAGYLEKAAATMP